MSLANKLKISPTVVAIQGSAGMLRALATDCPSVEWYSPADLSESINVDADSIEKLVVIPQTGHDCPERSPSGGCEDGKEDSVGCYYGRHYALIDGRLFFTFHPDDEYTIKEIEKDRRNFFFSSVLPDRYQAFCEDFGPNHMSLVVRFCREVHEKYQHPKLQRRPLIYYCDCTYEHATNTALMLGAYLMLQHGKTPEEAVSSFKRLSPCPLRGFRDATFCPATFRLDIVDCLRGLRKALSLCFLTKSPSHFVQDFDCDQYDEWYDPMSLGFNRITPKFIAFAGPSLKRGPFNREPSEFVEQFRKCGVTMVVRLNEPDTYDARFFTDEGIAHRDLFFDDCTVPDAFIIKKFLDICDRTEGCIAVHCLAGLGRTGTLIAVYLIKNYGFTAREAIGYIRLMRPGSVIGPQQHFLETVERSEWQGNNIILSRTDAKATQDKTSNTSKLMSKQVTSAFRKRMTG